MPPAVRYFFDDGSILYNDENICQHHSVSPSAATQLYTTRTMTPNERLKPVDKKALLSSILKFLRPGNWRMIKSTHIIDAMYCVNTNLVYLESPTRPKKTLPPTVHAAVCQYSPIYAHARTRIIARIPMPLTTAMIQPRVSLSSMLHGAAGHAGTFLRDVDVDRARGQECVCEASRGESVYELRCTECGASICCRDGSLQQRRTETALW